VCRLILTLAGIVVAAMPWPEVLAMGDVQSRPARGAEGQAMQVDVAKVSKHEYPFDMDRAVRAELIEAMRDSYDRFDPAQFERGPDGKYPLIGKGKAESPLGRLYPAMHLTLSPRPGREAADRTLARKMILRAIRQGLFRSAGHEADGVWQWQVSDDEQPYPRDRNTSGFMGCALVRIWANDPVKLADWPAADLAEFTEAVRVSVDASLRHWVRIGYVNPQMLDFYLCWVAADLLGESKYRDTAREHLKQFLTYARTTDEFEEYVSPTYMAVNLEAAVALAHYTKDTPDAALTRELCERTWRQVAAAAHGPTRQLCGPHARAYTDVAVAPDRPGQRVPLVYAWLHLAAPDVFVPLSGDRSLHAGMFIDLAAVGFYVPLGIPADARGELRASFAEPLQRRTVVEWIGRCAWRPPYDLSKPATDAPAPRFRLATRYRTSTYCVGSVNEQDAWLQRRSVLAYWLDESGRPTGLKWQVAVTVDDPDAYLADWLFMMGVELISLQDGAEVIGAYRSAPVVRAAPGDVVTAPARIQSIGRRGMLEPGNPVVWMLGTHWRQGIEPEQLRGRVKELWIGITPVGPGAWQRLDEAGTRWVFGGGATEAVIETPTGATVVKRANRAGSNEVVECLQLYHADGLMWDWLSPPAIFLPFGLKVQAKDQQHTFGPQTQGDARACEIRRGELKLKWQSPTKPDRIQQRTWWGYVGGREVLPDGFAQ